MGKKKTSTKINQTTTPVVTEPYKTELANYTGMIGDFLDIDPTQYVAPASELQTQAFGDAQNLGGWQTYLNQANTLAGQYASHPATQVTATGYQAPDVPDAYQFGGAQLGQAAQYGGTNLGPAAQTQAAQLGSATGYSAPRIGSVAGPAAYQAGQTNIGSSPTVNLGGYGLPQLGDAALASSQGLLGDASRIKDYMGDYQNPYTQQVIDATLADFDEYAGTQRAAQDAQAGLTGAFGGSRYGIMEGQLEGELARGRASTQAALLDQQYRLSAQLGGQDAGAANQFALQNANMGLQTQFANQNALNQFGLAEYGAGIDQARYGADASNQGALANRDAAMQFAMAQFGADTQAAQQYASALNAASQAGYQGDLTTALTQAGFDADSARYYADATNQFNLTQSGYQQQANLANQDAVNNFMLQQGLLDQQTGQLNMEAMNQFALQQGLLDQQTGQYNTDALNNFLMTQVGLDADSARYYADALNQASFANADLQEQAYQRELEAAGLQGDLAQLYGTQSLADLGMTADLGTLQRSLESEYLNAYPTQLQLAGNLYSQLSPALYSGATMTGKNTSTQSGGWLAPLAGSALQAGAIAFSDRRLKSNIVRVGEKNGLNIYEYDIFGRRERGVMADEVPPEALGPVIGGYATVDYSRI